MPEFISSATRFVALPDGFPMKRGGVLNGSRIAYESYGNLNETRNNVILILTGLSPSAHAASHEDDPTVGWWEGMIGPGRPVDTDEWHVICINALGSCKGSTGPASVDPRTGESYRLSFPELSIEDIADAAASAVRALGIPHVECVIGASMGGMASLALITRHPELVRNHINISGAVHSTPFASAIRSVQREAIQTDAYWRRGQYNQEQYPENGMITARKLGLISYRSALEWDGRFGRDKAGEWGSSSPHFAPELPVEMYLDYHARRFARTFDPNSYLYLSRSIDRFDLGDMGTLAGMHLERAMVIGVRSDLLFPLHQQDQIAEGLRTGGTDVTFLAMESEEGHDAFLIDLRRFGPPIARFLSSLLPQLRDAAPLFSNRRAGGSLD
ncbi:homoserine O-acetyltransferase [Cryobacterium sp. MDB1-18-2]|uniref:homoserine O-acetyltransferase MetX n=1 Tax=unclassified Cryobacterium TaxID=2649013 RepID=UPI00106D06FA|nr:MULTISPECIES: homoserine O-acetyltransferase [unclassified Cryobacterium]TFC32099.1 homoserine O-acetyltransferase [Cryobacterium sp. MDB1-18-2]TFC42033.1 homoserine O-acetyltransferase [Cryobacterium sp. MDB1-18-1]